MTWSDIVKFFQDIYPIINVLIAIAWGFYLYFTIKTFREIHHQTELQSDAFLMITFETTDSVSEKVIDKTSETSNNSHSKWKAIISKNIAAAVGPDSNLIMTLINKGRSDIIDWKIKITLKINSGQYLTKNLNNFGETTSWSITYKDRCDRIEPGQNIVILVAKVGAYPEGTFSWEVEYSDMRGKKYKTFSGEKDMIVKNVLALDVKE